MKLEKEFVWAEWEDVGQMGWEPVGCGEVYNANSYPPGLAHDVLEHFELDTVEDEIEAHACMYWLRYEGGHRMTFDAFPDEWTNLYNGVMMEGGLHDAPTQEPLDEAVEEELAEIIIQGRQLLNSEHEQYLERDIADRLAEVFADWFRSGYRKAEERYGKLGRGRIVCIFDEIQELFEQENRREKFGGERLLVSIDLESGNVDEFRVQLECHSCGAYAMVDHYACEDCQEAEEEE